MPHQKSSAAGPVFVVGMNGSGTTMLADCLGKHPALYVFPQETRILPIIIPRLHTFGDLVDVHARRRLAATLAGAKAFWHENRCQPIRLSDAELAEPGLLGVLNAIYGHFAQRDGKIRWGDKTPMYLQHMELLARHLPHAKFIHIYRDGRDAAQSFHRRWGYDPRRSLYRWKKIVRYGREQGRRMGPNVYFEVSYEHLTAAPEVWMKRICQYLGLDYDAKVLDASMRYMDPAAAARGIVRNSGKWTSYFSGRQIVELEAIGGAFLRDLGYNTIGVAGDEDPATWRLWLWQQKDRVFATRQHFRDYGYTSASVFLKLAKDSLLQGRTNRF